VKFTKLFTGSEIPSVVYVVTLIAGLVNDTLPNERYYSV